MIKVYVDGIEGWQEIEEYNFKQIDEYRAVVKTKNDTRVTRVIKHVNDISECKADGCIYVIKEP